MGGGRGEEEGKKESGGHAPVDDKMTKLDTADAGRLGSVVLASSMDNRR